MAAGVDQRSLVAVDSREIMKGSLVGLALLELDTIRATPVDVEAVCTARPDGQIYWIP